MYREKKAINIALYGLLIALAMVLSFVETLIPIPIPVPVPGVKLGLANLVTVVGLYLIGIPGTIAVTLIRIVLVGLSFGNPYSMTYGLSGSFLKPVLVMAILKKTGKLLPDRYQRPRRHRPQHRSDHIRSCHCPDSRRILLSPVPPRRRLHRRNPDRSCRRDHYRTPDARNARYKKIKYRLY